MTQMSRTLEKLIKVILILVGLINFAPVIGIISAERLESMYAVSIASSDLEILMRHRAVLFGIVGGFVIISAFRSAWRKLACVAGFVSMISFVVLAYSIGNFGEQLKSVVMIDIFAIVVLSIGTVLVLQTERESA